MVVLKRILFILEIYLVKSKGKNRKYLNIYLVEVNKCLKFFLNNLVVWVFFFFDIFR